MMAEEASSSCARMVHEELARLYAKRIAETHLPSKTMSDWATWKAFRWLPSETYPQPVAAIATV